MICASTQSPSRFTTSLGKMARCRQCALFPAFERSSANTNTTPIKAKVVHFFHYKQHHHFAVTLVFFIFLGISMVDLILYSRAGETHYYVKTRTVSACGEWQTFDLCKRDKDVYGNICNMCTRTKGQPYYHKVEQQPHPCRDLRRKRRKASKSRAPVRPFRPSGGGDKEELDEVDEDSWSDTDTSCDEDSEGGFSDVSEMSEVEG